MGKAGRPRKVQSAKAAPVAVAVTEPEVEQDREPIVTPEPELKACPNCGGEAHAWQDKYGLWRCACKDCGWWDSIAKYSKAEAVNSYNGSGGPVKEPVFD